MRKTAITLILALLTGSVLAGDLTNPVTGADATKNQLILDLLDWSETPTHASNCESGACCPNATPEQCNTFAKNFVANQEFWVRTIFKCIQKEAAWACQVDVAEGKITMICQTIPATDSVRKGDVAGCASSVAAVQN